MSNSPVPVPITKASAGLPLRDPETHKGDYGRVLIVGGSVGFAGAPNFSARAAVRTGAGLVFLYVPEPIYAISAMKNDEAMVFPLPGESGQLAPAAVPSILQRLQAANVCLIGPGLGRSAGVDSAVCAVLQSAKCPVVLDADGINSVSRNINMLSQAAYPPVLTPHDGEYARLGGDLSGMSREASAVRFAEAHRCVLVLKGHRTLVAFPDGDLYVNTTGNAGMAKGGSGDVLAGILAALLAQGFPMKKAVTTGVFLHGFAGDLCAGELGEYGMTPSDMIAMLPAATKALTLPG